MATQLFFNSGVGASLSLATNSAKRNGATSGWSQRGMDTSRAGSLESLSANTVTGATNGVEVTNGSLPVEWISMPVDADVTIAGTITVNIWCAENNMSANVAINCVIERIDGKTGQVASTIATTARIIEAAVTTAAVNNFTVTPTSTAMNKGDRIRARIFGDDAGTMATGFSFTVGVGGGTAAANGDSYITFTETFGFIIAGASTTTFYCRDTALNGGREMQFTRGSGGSSINTPTTSGWTAPIECGAWYSPRLNAFTLAAPITFKIEGFAPVLASWRATLGVCDADGSSEVTVVSHAFILLIPGSSGSSEFHTACDDISVATGQRLVYRIFIDDSPDSPMVFGGDATVQYNGAVSFTGQNTYVSIAQAVTEATVAPPTRPTPTLMWR